MPKNYINNEIQLQDSDVILHEIVGIDTLVWWAEGLGYLKFEPDDPMFGPARVFTMAPNIPEYQNGQTNWDVGFACIFDY